MVFFDGIVFNSRKDNKNITKWVYSVLGINMEGQKHNVMSVRRISSCRHIQTLYITMKLVLYAQIVAAIVTKGDVYKIYFY